MSELPKSILAAEIDDLGLCTGTVEELAELASDANMEELRVGRYKLVGMGSVHQSVDYIEDGEQE